MSGEQTTNWGTLLGFGTIGFLAIYKVVEVLNGPEWLQWVLFVIGFAGLIYVGANAGQNRSR